MSIIAENKSHAHHKIHLHTKKVYNTRPSQFCLKDSFFFFFFDHSVVLTCSKIIDAFFDHATILSPSFHGLRKERLAQWPPICVQNRRREEGAGGWGGTSRNISRGCAARFLKPLPYFTPEVLEPGAWPERVTSCYGTYTVGVNIKGEMVLSPNDKDVASSKKHTQFKTRVHKPYPI